MSSSGSSQNRRVHERKAVAAEAVIEYKKKTSACIVHDISIGGAKVEAKLFGGVNEPANLQFKRHEPIDAKLVWQKNDLNGLKFIGYSPQIGKLVKAITRYV